MNLWETVPSFDMVLSSTFMDTNSCAKHFFLVFRLEEKCIFSR